MDGSVASRRIGPPRAGIAERIWEAARIEFSKRGYHGARVQGIARGASCNVALIYRHWASKRGYHGARVQGIARGASCNVALIYRHWASKRALYLDILRAVWLNAANEIAGMLENGSGASAEKVVGAYLDAMNRDPMGAQVLVREYLDGAPFLSQLTTSDPSLLDPVRRAASVMAGTAEHGIDPVLAVVTVGGLSALVASAQEAVRPFVSEPPEPDAWRQHVLNLLTHGLSPSYPGEGAKVT